MLQEPTMLPKARQITSTSAGSRSATRYTTPMDSSLSKSICPTETIMEHEQAVERVILAMHECLGEPWSLEIMAKIAQFSPYHFSRVFHQITNLPPGRFLSALRMEAAKRLLLLTDLTVTDICFEIGYQSLGSFTRDFTRLVGLPPRLFRSFCEQQVSLPPEFSAEPGRAGNISGLMGGNKVRGTIRMSDKEPRLIFVGLFTHSIPQGKPLTCTLLDGPGVYEMDVPEDDGISFLFAAAFPYEEDPLLYQLSDPKHCLVGLGQSPLTISDGQIVSGGTDLMLQPLKLTDPPILVALPVLLAKRQSVGEPV